MKEMEEMVNKGILRRKHGGSKWALLMLVVPKKDNRIRIVSGFREVSMLTKRKPYPTQSIHGIMQKSWCTHFRKMDLSMQFYCFELDEESKKNTTTITPDDQLYKHNTLPKRTKISPVDDTQVIMGRSYRDWILLATLTT